jgi:hypothetical protein
MVKAPWLSTCAARAAEASGFIVYRKDLYLTMNAMRVLLHWFAGALVLSAACTCEEGSAETSARARGRASTGDLFIAVGGDRVVRRLSGEHFQLARAAMDGDGRTGRALASPSQRAEQGSRRALHGPPRDRK